MIKKCYLNDFPTSTAFYSVSTYDAPIIAALTLLYSICSRKIGFGHGFDTDMISPPIPFMLETNGIQGSAECLTGKQPVKTPEGGTWMELWKHKVGNRLFYYVTDS